MTLLQEPNALKQTPLYTRHLSLKAKMTDFGGWNMPVYYSGIIEEHLWTRRACGFFDVSHLGEFHVKGEKAFYFLQNCLTNDLNKIKPGQILYNLLCDKNGFVLDDVLVYQGGENDYFVVVNAGNIDKDFGVMKAAAGAGVEIKNNSDSSACIAVQGPDAEKNLEKIFGFRLSDMGYYSFRQDSFQGSPVWISRSGYTGEDGFELFAQPDRILTIWDKLMDAGKLYGMLPCGLGSRNTLRLEAGNPLYGHEMDDKTTPLEAGLGFAVSFEKGDFVGREALVRQKMQGLEKRLAGFRMLDKAIARDHYAIYKNGQNIGRVTSGSFAPSANGGIGMGFVKKGFEMVGSRIEIEIHGRQVPAEIVKRPFITLKHKK